MRDLLLIAISITVTLALIGFIGFISELLNFALRDGKNAGAARSAEASSTNREREL